MLNWIRKWNEIENDEYYICCPLRDEGDRCFLSNPIRLERGWMVKQYMEGVYVALKIGSNEIK